MKENCIYCGTELDGSCTLTPNKGEFAHPSCWHKLHSFKERQTFREVLSNGEDQVLVRDLLEVMIPDHAKERIIVAFNQIMIDRHKTKFKQNQDII